MLAVQVELLTGRYAATQFNDRSRAEWPPHPARLFSAAVAAWADADEPDERERAALRWWEQQGAPTVTCSWHPDGERERVAVTHFVPVNDTQVVGRDLSVTYGRLRSALGAVDDASDGNPKVLAKAEAAAAKMRSKAENDSRKAASTGTAPRSAIGILPDSRGRQPRMYPTTIPEVDRVVYRWPEADGDSPHAAALGELLVRVPRLGHTSSLVSVMMLGPEHADTTSAEAVTTLVPHQKGGIGLRVASSGQLDALESAFVAHQGIDPRALPALVSGYQVAGESRAPSPTSLFDPDWTVLELAGGAQFTIRDALALGRAVRGALLHHSELDPAPEIISGHVPGDEKPTPPTSRPHLAIVALPFVGAAHADGRVGAIALVLPTDLAAEERRQVESALGRWIDGGATLNLGSRGTREVRPIDRNDAPGSAKPFRWCSPARRWMTVTPIALDRNPGNLRHLEPARRDAAEHSAEEIIKAACVNIGLPVPTNVAIHTCSLVRGSSPVRSFPKYAVLAGRVQRVLVHAAIEFEVEVEGPVLLGAGRYHGYGLCLPLAATVG